MNELQQRIEGVSTKQLIENLDNAVIDCLMVPNEWLPENYRGKKSHRKLRSVVNQSKRKNKTNWKDPRDVSVKFDKKQNVVQATNERLATIEKYRATLADGGEIKYDINEDRQYNKNLLWVSAMVTGGYIDPSELIED